MKVEEVINFLGFGRFQKRLIVFGTAMAICISIQNLSVVFYTYSPDHRCAIPGLDNDSYRPFSEHHQELINLSIPDGDDGKCFMYDYKADGNLSGTETKRTQYQPIVRSLKKKCNRWVYDNTIVTRNVVTEFNLVCDRSILTAHGQMVFFAGFFIGSCIFGIIGDFFGRKTASLIGLYGCIACSIGLKWITSFTAFMVLRFFVGACIIGSYANMFVLVLEFISSDNRVVFSFVHSIGRIFGLVVMVFVAYMVRDWRNLVLALSVPFIVHLSFIWFLPESVRWSLKQKKFRTAESLLVKIAKENKLELPKDFLDPQLADEKTESIVKIFTTPELLKRFIVLSFNWIGVVLVYYGLTLNSGNLGGNLYVNMLTSVAIEIPGYIVVRLLINRVGRKALHISLMICCGIACIATLFPVMFNRTGLQWLTLTLATLGKFAGSAAFAVMYIYTPELFPTTVRMSALGSLSGIARVGGIAAPYIVELAKQIRSDISVAVPLLVFGSYAVMCGLLCLVLPETKRSRLLETTDDVKHMQWMEKRYKESTDVEITKSVQMKSFNSLIDEMGAESGFSKDSRIHESERTDSMAEEMNDECELSSQERHHLTGQKDADIN